MAVAVLFLQLLEYMHARCEIWRYYACPVDALCDIQLCPCRDHVTLNRSAMFELLHDWLLEDVRRRIGRNAWRIEVAIARWAH